jgi:hypothetical protein
MDYSDTSIFIHLINDSNQKDDIIRIKKNLSYNEFDIRYTDQNNDSPIVHNLNGLYRAQVMDYIYAVFKNQALDEQGYHKVQVTLPAMPRIIVSGDKFKDLYYREHFMDTIGKSLDTIENVVGECCHKYNYNGAAASSLPRGCVTPSHRSTSPGVRPQHLFFDE